MSKFLSLSFLLVCSLWSTVWAQDRRITGKVTSAEDNLPLPGVSVVVKGTTKGATTDAGGMYSLDVPGSKALLALPRRKSLLVTNRLLTLNWYQTIASYQKWL